MAVNFVFIQPPASGMHTGSTRYIPFGGIYASASVPDQQQHRNIKMATKSCRKGPKNQA